MIRKLFYGVFLLCVLSTHAQTNKRVKISNITQQQILQLSNAGIDMHCGVYQDGNDLILELTPYEQGIITSLAFNSETLIENLSVFYAERAMSDMETATTTLNAMKSRQPEAYQQRSSVVSENISNIGQYTGDNEINWTVPQNFNLGSYAGSLTLDEALAELDAMHAQYPNLITARLAAASETTIEGRTVYYVKISDNPDIDEDEPETLYNSLIHAREISSLMNQLYYMWYLLENYDTDPSIKNLIDHHELYFIPILNPDGYQFNIDNNPNGGGLQRKNRRVTANCGGDNDGVDLNRNSGYFWNNGGASSNPCAQDFRGTGPFSEPESRIIRDFVLSRDFKVALDHHAFSNILYHSYSSIGSSTGREDEFAQYGHDMSYYNRYGYGAVTETGPPVASGSHIDWLLGGTIPDGTGSTGSGKNIIAFSPENGSSAEGGFYPSPSNILPIAQRAMRVNLLAAYYSGKYAKYKDLTPSNLSAITGQLQIGIEYLGQTASPITVTVTPISSNINAIGTSQTVNLAKLEQTTLNFSYELDTNIQPGDRIQYEVTVANEDFTLYQATIEKQYTPTTLFVDTTDTNGLSNWTNNGWELTTDTFTGTNAITNTTSSYGNNTFETLTLANSIDLSTSQQTVIQFFAKWDIERDFDYAQLEGSIDGGASWTPLVGKYTKPGSPSDTNPYSQKSNADEAHQPDGQPLYDGDTQDKWSLEEIVIDATTNSFMQGASNVLVRFVFDSDSSNLTSGYTTTFEGFTFDDFQVLNSIPAPLSSQSITFPVITDQITTAGPITLNASASSGLPVSYSVIAGPATISGNVLVLDGTVGTVTVEATQDGNTSFEAATPVSVSFVVTLPACDSEVPQNVSVSAITATTAMVQWDTTNGVSYEVRFRESGNSIFQTLTTTALQIDLLNLTGATNYEVEVNSSCSDGSTSAYSTVVSFTTLSPPVTYCDASSNNATEEFISRFELNTINNSSGGQNYSDFTNISTTLETNVSYPITIEPTWTGSVFPEAYAIWIDYNQDGVFNNTTERVFTQTPTTNPSITGAFSVPSDALTGSTRLRVVMRYNTIPSSCGGYDFGEVEDYTVIISQGVTDTEAPSTPTNLIAFNITQIAATLSWEAATDNIGVTDYTVFQDGQPIATTIGTTYTALGLLPDTTYSFFVVANDFAGNTSNQSNSIQLRTLELSNGCVEGITALPYFLGFENGIDNWTQNTDDDIDWIIDANGTPSNGTGPSSAIEGQNYIYTEASGNNVGFPNKQAIITSPCIDLTNSINAYISFKYHMYGTSNNLGSIDLEVSINGGATWFSIWNEIQNKGNQWNTRNISLDAYIGFPIQLRYNRVTGSDFRGDVALDDIQIIQGEIPPVASCNATEIGYPYQVSFETNFNNWSQSTNDDLNWIRNGGGTPSANTGPNNANDGVTYLYVEASGNGTGFPNKQAILNSPCFDLSIVNGSTFTFDYHMFGSSDFGSIALEASIDDGTTWQELWSLTGNQGPQWNTQVIDLTSYDGGSVQLRFNRITGGTWQADFALDNIRLTGAIPSFTNETNKSLLGTNATTLASTNTIRLYPNPTTQGSFIKIQATIPVDFEVYTTLGKRIYKGTDQEQFIPTENLSSGVYFVHFKQNNKTITTKRFIIK
ncbi:M14 family zinc carboxypeptidase [uncultured Dokdonia sp.]|uniref:M14 family zinc carboxypeptidase n=1 Tax=uncultured Dokdonia sp. TaxID=575653 RepID=UPI00260D23C8|nr:M14 family zinc carboxypeptidase [uncultured Dokdonia sp.]